MLIAILVKFLVLGRRLEEEAIDGWMDGCDFEGRGGLISRIVIGIGNVKATWRVPDGFGDSCEV